MESLKWISFDLPLYALKKKVDTSNIGSPPTGASLGLSPTQTVVYGKSTLFLSMCLLKLNSFVCKGSSITFSFIFTDFTMFASS